MNVPKPRSRGVQTLGCVLELHALHEDQPPVEGFFAHLKGHTIH